MEKPYYIPPFRNIPIKDIETFAAVKLPFKGPIHLKLTMKGDLPDVEFLNVETDEVLHLEMLMEQEELSQEIEKNRLIS